MDVASYVLVTVSPPGPIIVVHRWWPGVWWGVGGLVGRGRGFAAKDPPYVSLGVLVGGGQEELAFVRGSHVRGGRGLSAVRWEMSGWTALSWCGFATSRFPILSWASGVCCV